MITDYGFTLEKLEQRIAELGAYLVARSAPIGPFRRHVGETPGAALPGTDDSSWEAFRVGQTWGGDARRNWFRAKLALPDWFVPGDTSLYLAPGGDDRGGGLRGFETLVYLDGVETQAIDPRHLELLLPATWKPGETHLLAIHAYCGTSPGWTTWDIRKMLDANPDADPNPRYGTQTWTRAEIGVVDRRAEQLYYDALAMRETALLYDADDRRRTRLINALDEAMGLIDWRHPGSDAFRSSAAAAADALRASLDGMEAGDVATVVATGHAHIDVAWLWPLDVTREKAARTFSTALHLMEQYPDYVFTQSQTQLYKYLQEDHPALFERIKRKIADGQWAATGAMWVEADCNISSGESLVRQILFGKRYFRDELGVDSRLLWLPDVFGYSAALPQILKRSGVDYFMTQKISWNQYNRLPVDTFQWEGIDGSEVLTHFLTTPGGHGMWSTYNGNLSPQQMKGTWDNYLQKRLNDVLITAFGFGDGGGGPTKEMLESARRLANMPGIPRVEMGEPEGYMDRLAANVGDDAPKWVGELYLEYHRGTYTSQARNKRANRKSELLYRDAELYASMAQVLLGQAYPRGQINEGWELILLNQFHDIIPGSSINQVYKESLQQYAAVRNAGERVRDNALSALAGAVDLPAGPGLVVYNSTSWPRHDLVSADLPADAPAEFDLRAPDGASLPYQTIERPGGKRILFQAQGVPPCGWQSYNLVAGVPAREGDALTVTKERIETPFWTILLNDAGQITSLWDKRAQRQAIPEGAVANRFLAFEDKPMRFDAWDIDVFYQDDERPADGPAQVTVEETGPVRGRLRITLPVEGSTVTQWLTVYHDLPRIDFETEVEWQERQTLLKVAFPVDVPSQRATYDIQFGNVERPTHWNTSWDWARFESCAHKWVDLSEGDYGVSLLNDCKYGHDIRGNTMRLTLLKSALSPDPLADQGHHEFTYSLLPHRGDWRQGTVPAAYELNVPLMAAYRQAGPGVLPASYALVQVDRPGVIAEAIKLAEDRDDLIVRVYECYNSRGPVTLRFGSPIASAYECDLMERVEEELETTADTLTLEIKPYQIRTIGIRLA